MPESARKEVHNGINIVKKNLIVPSLTHTCCTATQIPADEGKKKHCDQDRYLIELTPLAGIYDAVVGVFDGHGEGGEQAAQLCVDKFCLFLAEEAAKEPPVAFVPGVGVNLSPTTTPGKRVFMTQRYEDLANEPGHSESTPWHIWVDKAVRRAFTRCDEMICDISEREQDLGGCTAVVTLIKSHDAGVLLKTAWAGDSRAIALIPTARRGEPPDVR
mmetsp:Transcript_64565/g.203798  ORF Transcript_64565/g.203798 Transcript_64565/m.203798 type:complete len:216 (-) Transcript_64565:195-842(-)